MRLSMKKYTNFRNWLYVMATSILLLGIYNLNKYLILVSTLMVILLILVGSFYPRKIVDIYFLFVRTGEIIGSLTNPILLAFIYFLIITPYAIVFKIIGRDILKISKNNEKTYWVDDFKNEDLLLFNKQY
jgi:hypothetical protein